MARQDTYIFDKEEEENYYDWDKKFSQRKI
jgi:hypothetical protein